MLAVPMKAYIESFLPLFVAVLLLGITVNDLRVGGGLILLVLVAAL